MPSCPDVKRLSRLRATTCWSFRPTSRLLRCLNTHDIVVIRRRAELPPLKRRSGEDLFSAVAAQMPQVEAQRAADQQLPKERQAAAG